MLVSKRIILARHSFANYEAAFSSEALTDDGIKDAKTLGLTIAPMIGDDDPVKVISSDAFRAIATAEWVSDAIGFPLVCIQIEPALSNYRVYDRARRDKEFFERLIKVEKLVEDLHGLDGLYMTGHPCWDQHPDLFEPRHSVASRVFRWLGRQVQSFHDARECDTLIAITHAEVMNLVLSAYGFNEPVKQCEILDLWLDITNKPGVVTMTSIFRGKEGKLALQVPSRAFGTQFGNWWG